MLQMYVEFDIDGFLHESFKADLEKLKDKYEIHDEEKKAKIRKIVGIVDKYDVNRSELSLDYLLELSMLDISLVEFYYWVKYELDIESLNEARELFDVLEADDYVITNNEYLISYKNADLDDYYEDKLTEKLEDVRFVSTYYDTDDLARMWVHEETVDEVIKGLLYDEDEVQDILGLDFYAGIELSNGKVLRYSLIE